MSGGTEQEPEKSGTTARFFNIEASMCSLRPGDRVEPDTIIGRDIVSGNPLHADCYGTVQGITFNGPRHSLLVIVMSL